MNIYDNTAKLWQVASGKRVKTLGGHTSVVIHASFSPDGTMLATASDDNTAKLWQVTFSTQELIDYANKLISRCLTPKQQQDFFLSDSPRWELIENGEQLAKTGEIQKAITQFQFAKQQARCFKFDPENKARRIAATARLEEGKELAKQGKIQEAAKKFTDALQVDPRLVFEPENYAKRLAAQELIKKGEELALEGKHEEAVAKFKEALALDSSLNFDPETKAKQLFAPVLVEQGQELAANGDIEAAIAKYQQAQQMDASLEIDAWQWNEFCWNGSVYGPAASVMSACTKAVELEPKEGDYRRSRGLARALTGNTQGAIEDFQFVVEWATEEWQEDQKQQAQGWIDALKKGENPFTEEVLEELR